MFGTTVQCPDMWTFFMGWKRWRHKMAKDSIKLSYSPPPAGYSRQQAQRAGSNSSVVVAMSPERWFRENWSANLRPGQTSPRPRSGTASPHETLDDAKRVEHFQRAEAALLRLKETMVASRTLYVDDIEAENRRLNGGSGSCTGPQPTSVATAPTPYVPPPAEAATGVPIPTSAPTPPPARYTPILASQQGLSVGAGDDISDIYGEVMADDTDTAWDEFKSMFESAGIVIAPSKPVAAATPAVSTPPPVAVTPALVRDTQPQPVRSPMPAAFNSPQPSPPKPPSSWTAGEGAWAPSGLPRNNTFTKPALAHPRAVTEPCSPLVPSPPDSLAPSPPNGLSRRPNLQLSAKGIFARKLAEVKGPHVEL